MSKQLEALKSAALGVLMGVRRYDTGTDTLPERSVIETWRIKQLGEALRNVNEIEGGQP